MRRAIEYGQPLAGGCASGQDKWETDEAALQDYAMKALYDDVMEVSDTEV